MSIDDGNGNGRHPKRPRMRSETNLDPNVLAQKVAVTEELADLLVKRADNMTADLRLIKDVRIPKLTEDVKAVRDAVAECTTEVLRIGHGFDRDRAEHERERTEDQKAMRLLEAKVDTVTGAATMVKWMLPVVVAVLLGIAGLILKLPH